MTSAFGPDVVEELAFFARSPSRLRILELLADEDLTRDEIRDRLSVSQSTAQRNLRDLVDRDYLAEHETDATYSLRLPGEVVYRQLREACDALDAAVALREFCRHFPASPPLSPSQLSAVTVATPTGDHPFRPTEMLSDLLATDADVCLCNPVCNPLYLEQLDARFRDPGLETELVVTESAAARLRERCSLPPSELADRRDTTVLVAESLPRFGIALADRTAVLVSYGPDQKTHSVLRTDDETTALFRWLLDAYAANRGRSEPLVE